MSRRMAIVWIAIVLLLGVLIALVPRAESAESTLALRRFLAASGRQVSEGGPPPEAGGTYVILHDLRTPDEARSLLAWAASGGRLVVADPRSTLVTLSGASVGDPVGLVGARSLEPACLAEEALGVRSIVVRASDRSLRGGDRFVSCFGGHLLVRSHDRGTLVLLGGFTALTNEHLRTADNALLALRLAGSEGPVVFGPPVPAEVAAPATGVWGALPERAKVAILAIAVEESITPIPASELVRATSRLYRSARSLGHAAGMMREATRARVGRRLGVPAESEALPTVAAHVTGLPPERVEQGLSGPDPRTDEELIRLGSLLSEIESRTMTTAAGTGADAKGERP